MSETEETHLESEAQTQETHTGEVQESEEQEVQESEEQGVQDRTPRRQLELPRAETEEAALEAQLRFQMEDDIDSTEMTSF